MNYLQFGIYFLTFMLTEAFVNERAVATIGVDLVNYVYAVGLLFTAAGYYSFSLIKGKIKKTVELYMMTLTAVSFLGLTFLNYRITVLIFGYLSLLLLGYVGGYVHYTMGFSINDELFGMKLGISASLAIVLQFIIQNVISATMEWAVVLMLMAIFIIITPWVKKISEDVALSISLPISGISITSRILVYGLCVAIMSVILGFQDSIMVARNAAGEIELFSCVRLFYALGLFLAGLVAQLKDRVYLPLAAGCAMILSVLAISFLERSVVLYNLSMSLMYFYSGFYVVFLTIMFMELGIRRSNMELYGGMGRVVRCVATCVTVLFTSLLGSVVPSKIYAVLSCILSIGLIIVMALSGILIPERRIIDEVLVPADETSFEEKLTKIYEQYGLTPKEQEIFSQLVTTELGVQEIADEMFVSRRVLQRHIAAIYEKTGAKTRVGLLMLLK